jgi:hypothetical protein
MFHSDVCGAVPVNANVNAISAQPVPSNTVRAFIARKPRLLINGEWVEARTERTIAVYDPATGREIARVADAGIEDVDRAVAAARAAFDSGPWPEMSPAGREALMWKLSDLIALYGQHYRCARGPRLVPLHGRLGH